MEIGEKIRKLLKDNKLSLREFCIKHNLIYTTVTFQINKNNPGYDILSCLTKEFPGIDVNWLFGESENNGATEFHNNNQEIIDEVIEKLVNLKNNLTQI